MNALAQEERRDKERSIAADLGASLYLLPDQEAGVRRAAP